MIDQQQPLWVGLDDNLEVIDPWRISADLFAGNLQNMRQSTIGSFSICPNRVKYSRDNPGHYGGSDATVIGTAYHAGLETFYYAYIIGESQPSQETMYAAICDTVDKEMLKIGGVSMLSWNKFSTVDELKDQACALLDARMQHPLFQAGWEPVAIELTFRLPWIQGWAATGTVDLVLWNAVEGRYRIVDHKTAGRMWQKNKHLKSPQPHWYSMMIQSALEAAGFVHPPVEMDFEIITYGGKFETRTVTPTAHTMDVWNNKARIAALAIESDGPWYENTDSNLCSPMYCDAWEACPSGQTYHIELGK